MHGSMPNASGTFNFPAQLALLARSPLGGPQEGAPAAVAAAAGSRAAEVYMGVDVFGRGSYGGGKVGEGVGGLDGC